MKIPKILGFVSLVSLLFCSCSASVDTSNKLVENKKVTSENLNSIINVSKESKNISISDKNQLKQNNTIENLPDGSYRFCLKPASIENTNGFDGEAWCFEFNKFNSNVVGTYSYQAPKDTAQICIEGFAKGNQVKGVGYELIQYGETKPDIEEEKLRLSQDSSFISTEGYWDNSQRGDETGNNLKVDFPNFYKLIEPEQEGNDYWAWIRFDIAQLDVSKFYQRELRTHLYQGKLQEIFPVTNCVN
jgi:hypothetical protein